MRSSRVRNASMMPLMPSPGRPKTTRTPQSIRRSTRTSDVVLDMCVSASAVYVKLRGESGERKGAQCQAQIAERNIVVTRDQQQIDDDAAEPCPDDHAADGGPERNQQSSHDL